MRAFVFPGQGSQRKGMGRDLFPRHPTLVRRADEILGYSIAELCLDDPRGDLGRGAFAQPAIFVVSVLAFLEARRTLPPPDCAAGHSVGEFAALAAAQVFDFETGLRLVAKRAALMAEADGGGLVAVVGLSPEAVEALLAEDGGGEGLSVANVNTPTQVVVGGPRDALDRFAERCRARGARAVPLRVSGAFHTAAMADAARRFRAFLETQTFRPPVIPVACNLTGDFHTGGDMAGILARHIESPVLWTRCVERMITAGVTDFEEIGGTRILTPMIEEIRRSTPPPRTEARLLPDWTYPELATRRRCLADDAVAGALEGLQKLYLRPGLAGGDLAALCRDSADVGAFLGPAAADCASLSGPALRARLRTLVRAAMRGRVTPCDGPRPDASSPHIKEEPWP